MAVANAPLGRGLNRQIETALRERRFVQAVELARQNRNEHPGPTADELWQRSHLAAIEHFAHRESFREAHPYLTEAETMVVDDPAWWQRLAELRADFGDHGRAMQLVEKAPAARARVLGRIVDCGLRDGPSGRGMMPPDLQAGFDMVIKSFGHYEAGRDLAAREAIEGIGISSPYLEWKLLLRGLMAWSANDMPRALENWSRLSADRLPAKLAAPFRLVSDKSFAASLPPDRVAAVARQADKLLGGVADGLRRIRKLLAGEATLPEAFETVRAIGPDLKRLSPESFNRLATIMYWSIADGGEPEDMARFMRIFGPPVDDPSFFRLQAMIFEMAGRLADSHAFWAKYEEWIARTPSRWPGEQGTRARAMILERMGRLARDWANNDDYDDDLDDFFSMFNLNARRPPMIRPLLRPTAEECFRKASELAPNWIKPATELLQEVGVDPVKAAKAVEGLLARFPNDLASLEAAVQLYERLGQTSKAHECLRLALQANPLDRNLRQRSGAIALSAARQSASAGDFDKAESSLAEATELYGPTSPAILALSAAMALRQRNNEAASKHRDALIALPNSRLSAPYRLTVEASRLKLKKKDAGLGTEFPANLTGPATMEELVDLLDALAQYRRESTAYYGQKTHDKKIVDRLIGFIMTEAKTEAELSRIGKELLRRKEWKAIDAVCQRGPFVNHDSPLFAFFAAEMYLAKQRTEYVSPRAGNMYFRTKQLLARCRDGRYRDVQEMLDERIKQTPEIQRWLDSNWSW